MNSKLTKSQRAIIISTNDLGRINIPCGSVCEMEAMFKTISELEAMGLVFREKTKAFYRPYQLTEDGKLLKARLSANDQGPQQPEQLIPLPSHTNEKATAT